jgi:hypothetical protein
MSRTLTSNRVCLSLCDGARLAARLLVLCGFLFSLPVSTPIAVGPRAARGSLPEEEDSRGAEGEAKLVTSGGPRAHPPSRRDRPPVRCPAPLWAYAHRPASSHPGTLASPGHHASRQGTGTRLRC